MNATQRLQIISSETNPQRRLHLLVDQGFPNEASQLIWDLVHTQTALFHFDWHDPDLCRPLKRVSKKRSAVYVFVTSSNRLDYHPYPHNHDPGDTHIVFELGWEREVLGWSEENSRWLVREILAHALARPLSQWSFKQAEGTGRAARRLLPADDPMAREVAALHLVYQLREADFGHICNYLDNIEGFPFTGGGWSKPLDTEGLVNWIAEQLLALGWTRDRICKEFAEWIWLRTTTWPQWLLAVAKAKLFANNNPVRAMAVRRWLRQRFDYILNTAPRRNDKKEMAEAYRQLFQMGQFAMSDRHWMHDKLVAQLASGKVSSVEWFYHEFGGTLRLTSFTAILVEAIKIAERVGNYGIALGLTQRAGANPEQRLVDAVEVRRLSTELE